MKNFMVHGFQATLAAGTVRLTDKQAKPRMLALKLLARVEEYKPEQDPKAKDPKAALQAAEAAIKAALPKVGDYQITTAINFKRREEFAWDGKPTRLQESTQFDELRKAREILAAIEAKRVEKDKAGARTVRAPR